MPGRRKTQKGLKERLAKLERKVSADSPEVLAHTIAVVDGAVTTSGIINYVTDIAQGDDVDDREGNEVKMIGFRWKGRLERGASDVVRTMSMRLVLFYDLHAVPGSLPALADIFDAVNVYSFQDVSNNQRFKILYDKTHDMQYLTHHALDFDTGLKKYTYKQKFTGAAGTSRVGRTLHWAVIPSNYTAGNEPSIASNIRMYFIDP